jgi:hypothetical protein
VNAGSRSGAAGIQRAQEVQLRRQDGVLRGECALRDDRRRQPDERRRVIRPEHATQHGVHGGRIVVEGAVRARGAGRPPVGAPGQRPHHLASAAGRPVQTEDAAHARVGAQRGLEPEDRHVALRLQGPRHEAEQRLAIHLPAAVGLLPVARHREQRAGRDRALGADEPRQAILEGVHAHRRRQQRQRLDARARLLVEQRVQEVRVEDRAGAVPDRVQLDGRAAFRTVRVEKLRQSLGHVPRAPAGRRGALGAPLHPAPDLRATEGARGGLDQRVGGEVPDVARGRPRELAPAAAEQLLDGGHEPRLPGEEDRVHPVGPPPAGLAVRDAQAAVLVHQAAVGDEDDAQRLAARRRLGPRTWQVLGEDRVDVACIGAEAAAPRELALREVDHVRAQRVQHLGRQRGCAASGLVARRRARVAAIAREHRDRARIQPGVRGLGDPAVERGIGDPAAERAQELRDGHRRGRERPVTARGGDQIPRARGERLVLGAHAGEDRVEVDPAAGTALGAVELPVKAQRVRREPEARLHPRDDLEHRVQLRAFQRSKPRSKLPTVSNMNGPTVPLPLKPEELAGARFHPRPVQMPPSARW